LKKARKSQLILLKKHTGVSAHALYTRYTGALRALCEQNTHTHTHTHTYIY